MARYAQEWGVPVALRPIRGGDIFSDIANLANSVISLVGQMLNWIGGFLASLTGLPSMLDRQLTGFFWGIFAPVKDALNIVKDRLWDIAAGAPGWLVSAAQRVADAVWSPISWGATRVYDGVVWAATTVYNGLSWVGSQVWTGATWAANRVWDGITWAAGRVWDGLSWVGSQVWTGATWAANRVWDGITWAAGRVWDGITWAANRVWDGLSWVGSQVWAGLTWAAEHVWDGLRPAANWLWDTFVEDPIITPGRGVAGFRSLLRPLSSIEDWFGRTADLVPTGSPVARFVFGIFTLMAMIMVIPQTLATVYSMPLHQEAALETGAALMSQAQIRDASLRGIGTGIPPSQQLRRYGFDANKVQAIMGLWDALPTPTDLVRFGVREVFTPEIAALFGQYQDFPGEFGAWMAKLGFTDFWAKAYWAAHWDLPSATQGFEMFHRDIIDFDQLELLLRAKDVMPFWRDKLIQINYRPLPLRQMRNMYAAGAVDDAGVRRNLLDLGYTPANVEKFVQWFKKDVTALNKDVPSGALLRAYRKRLVTRGEAEDALQALDYDADAVSLLLALEDLAIEEQRADLVEDVVKRDYKAGSISAAAAGRQLADVGVPPDRVALLIDLWTVEKAPRVLTLSAAEIQRAFREGLVPVGTARTWLHDLGYNETAVDIKLELATPEAAAPEPRELTVGQLQAAARRGFLSTFLAVRASLEDVVEAGAAAPEEIEALHRRFADRRYPEEDAWRLTALTFPEPEAPAEPRPKTLTAAQVLRAFKDGLISFDDARARLREAGYSEEDITILILENLPPEA